MRRKNKTVSGDVRPRNRTPGKRLVKPSFFETPWRRCWRHEIRGLNGRNRPATTLLRFECADGRKIGRVITKPDPDSADVDLS